MVVQHNLTAMNSNRMLGITTGTQAKSTEKLSSGYKINRAADDAAGLSISEKMRKQIRGLSQASLNAEDGISAVQTAEGALNEVQDMLQRMNELAVKAANGTMSENDRSYIQDEIKQLETEIDRVAETTKFNETYLLKGDKDVDKVVDYKYSTAGATLTKPDGSAIGNLYKANENTPLNAADAKEALANGETLYTNAKITTPTAATATEYTYTAASNAKITIDLTAWSANGTPGSGTPSAMKIDGVSLAQGTHADVDAIVTALGSATNITASKDASGKLVLTAKTATATVDELKALITDDNIDGAGSTLDRDADIIGTDAVEESVEIADGKKLYKADGTEVADEAEALAIYKANVAQADKGLFKDSIIQSAAVEGTDYVFEKTALYDKDGNKISENGLQFYYEDGTYTGGLYTDKNGENEVAVADIGTYVDDTQEKTGALTLKLHVGADATDNNQISVDLDAMSAAGIGVKDLKVDGADDTNARNAIETIKAAIQQVSQQRSALGAVQNRLEHTIANLDNVVENTTAAESQIRDTDMATEMVKYSNNNILAQAGQAMLAQANQANQGVLSLLG